MASIRICFFWVVSVVLAAGLSGCGDQGGTATAGLSISGVAPSHVNVGAAYQFRPTATTDKGRTLTFSITHLPAWAEFNSATGMIAGDPTAADVGVYEAISIAVSDGSTSMALTPFSISVEPASNASLTLAGAPATSVAAGASYNFRPTATSTSTAQLTFSISHLPPWATFDAGTGTLSGTPSMSNAGTYADIVISVSDGMDTAALAAFSIAVTATSTVANVTWTAPAANAGASELAGYHIYYGSSSSTMTHVVEVANPAVTSQTISDLTSGTWYFVVAAYNTAQIESALSPTVSAELL